MFREKSIRKHLIFSGRVQGVGFRYRAMNIAQMLGLTGWVKNRWDGKVEMEVQGKTGRDWKDDFHAVSAEIYLD